MYCTNTHIKYNEYSFSFLIIIQQITLDKAMIVPQITLSYMIFEVKIVSSWYLDIARM